MTLQSDIVTELNNLNAAKQAIKAALIAKGVAVSDSDTLLSYATKIGEIQMGDPVTLINNGVNGWYSVNEETGYVTMMYETPITNLSHYNSISAYGTTYYMQYTATLPVTFSRAHIVHWKLLESTANDLSTSIQDDYKNSTNSANGYTFVNGNQLNLSLTSDVTPLSGYAMAYIIGKLATS